VFVLNDGAAVTIGRGKENDVQVTHESLSRQHARLHVGARALLEDLGSRNGTYVDGVRVARCALAGACYLRCGDVVFAYVPAESSPALMPSMVHHATLPALDELLHRGAPTALQLSASSPVDRARDKLAVLVRVSELLSAPQPIDDMLRRALDLLFDILDIDSGVVVLVEDGELRPRVHKTRSSSESLTGEAEFSRQVVSYVLAHDVAALFGDAPRDQRIPDSGSIVAQSVQSVMCAPLGGRRGVLGALYVDNRRRADRFGAEDLEFLSAFANQAAIALENAKLSARLADEAVQRSALMRFFPPATVDMLLRSGGTIEVVEVEATVLFCDIAGYTELSCELAPTEVIALLNAYFPRMAEIVFSHGGTLEKYIGDALLAVWGAPIAVADHAERAIGAALDMQQAVAELAASRSIAVHIGICSGKVAAGNVGSDRYLQYATVGETTSSASRICDTAGPGEILIDERTAALLKPGAFSLEARGSVSLLGMREPRTLYSVRRA
jgi:adenylate cyclase